MLNDHGSALGRTPLFLVAEQNYNRNANRNSSSAHCISTNICSPSAFIPFYMTLHIFLMPGVLNFICLRNYQSYLRLSFDRHSVLLRSLHPLIFPSFLLPFSNIGLFSSQNP